MAHAISFTKISRNIIRGLIALGLLWSGSGMRAVVRPPQAQAAEAEFFKAQILPIFARRCQSCHNHTLKLSGLNLESAAALGTGGTLGPVVVPGNPQQSRLYRRVARLEKPFMPMDGDALPESAVALI